MNNVQNIYPWIFVAILLLLVIAAGFFVYTGHKETQELKNHLMEEQENSANLIEQVNSTGEYVNILEEQITNLSEQNDFLNKEIADYKTIEEKREAEMQAEIKQGKIEVIAPKAGDRFCLGETMNIKWQAPTDMQTVTVYLLPGGMKGFAIGSYPASSNEFGTQDGSGNIVWEIPQSSYLAGEGYTLRVNGVYNSRWIVSDPVGPFGLELCVG